GHGWRWNGMRITGTRKGPSLRAGCRGMALLIVTVGIGCDASTSPEVTEGLDMDGPEAVTLSDPNLDAAVRQILELGDAPVTEEAIRGLSRLGAPEAGITSLEGLEHAVNLEELFLPDNAVRDLQPLAGLSDLRRLDLSGNGLSDADAAPLGEMEALEVLSLDDNRLENMEVLGGLENLQVLSLAGNRISDPGPLSTLGMLRILDLSGNEIEELARLDGPAAPVGLLLDDNGIADLAPLLEHEGLRGRAAHVGLAGNPLSENSRCEHVPQLEEAGLTIRGAAPCSGASGEEVRFILTDRSIYVSERHRIAATFENRGEKILHGNKCSDGAAWEWQLRIEKLVDGAWQLVHEPARLLCLNPQQVHPEDVVRFASFPIGASTGTYRLVWPWIFEDEEQATPTPLEERVSAPFSV